MPIKKEVIIGGCRLILGDCLEVMPTLDKVDAIIADAPYFKIKGDFDFKYTDMESFIKEMEKVANIMKGRLLCNGSLLWFGDDKNVAYVQVMLDNHFNFLNHIVWDKKSPISKGEKNFRKFATRTERILFYEHLKFTQINKSGTKQLLDNPELFRGIKDYMCDELKKYSESTNQKTSEAKRTLNKTMNTSNVCYHYFGDYQWTMPTIEKYKLLQSTGFWKKEYESLRKEYESLRRPFNYHKGLYEVIKNHTSYVQEAVKGEHPTQKPIQLMEKLIGIVTNAGQTILDPFMGSGTTLIACAKMGRKGIGIEIDEDYFNIACKRVAEAYKSPDMFVEVEKRTQFKQEQLF